MLPMNELLQEGRYLITRQIGQNDVGSIYEGLDNIFDKKVFINQCAYNGRKNLSDEEKLLKELKHEAFLRVTDYFAETNGWFAVMEAEKGDFLSEILKNGDAVFRLSDVLSWTEQLLDGLSYIHLHLPPIIYGDIKPQNIILTSGGKVKFLTSAILKTRSSVNGFGKPSAEALTYSPLEQIWNSLDSASQKVIADSYDETAERILRQPVDARSDVYSLGVLIYQLLTNRFPKNALERSIEILDGNSDPLVSPDNLNAEIPPEISEVILKLLELRRENRFDSAVILRQVLRTAFIRINERETGAVGEKEPATTPAAEELFSLNDSTEHEEFQEAESVGKTQPAEKIESENLSTAGKKIEETEQAAAAADFEISLGLPHTENRPAPNEKNELLDLAEQSVETFETEASSQESNFEAGEPPPESVSENETEPEKVSADFFEFDESDEADVLGLRKSPEEIEETKETAGQVEEQTAVISAQDSMRILPEVPKSDYKQDHSPAEFSIFENTQEKSRSKWKLPVAVLILVLIGSGAFGAWMFVSKSGSNTENQTVSSETEVNPSLNTVSQPSAENQTQSTAETQTSSNTENSGSQTLPNSENAEITTEADIETNPVLAQETEPTAKNQSAVRARPSTTKPQTASAKKREKKKVTVDDLINDY